MRARSVEGGGGRGRSQQILEVGNLRRSAGEQFYRRCRQTGFFFLLFFLGIFFPINFDVKNLRREERAAFLFLFCFFLGPMTS